MFTGIIEGLGTIRQIRPAGKGKRVTVEADFPLDGTRIGDSIAVNGACLTAVVISGRRFDADLSPETVAKTALGRAVIGHRVNLERAMQLSGRLDGHLVSGHVDGMGELTSKKAEANALLLSFRVPARLAGFMIEKGSVAVNGISLTINHCDDRSFAVSIIPHTAGVTSLKWLAPGDAVNIETDMIGKYVKQFVTGDRERHPADAGKSPGIDQAFLARTGFLK